MFFTKMEHNAIDPKDLFRVEDRSFETPFMGFYELWSLPRETFGVAPGDYCVWKPKTVLKLSGNMVEIPLKVGFDESL